MRIAITGGKGQLAFDLARAFAHADVTSPSRDELDITSREAVSRFLHDVRPDFLINTAAFHQVDLCETEPEQSFAVNAAAPQRLAVACRSAGALFVHCSTDYVFGGDKDSPYTETDPCDPISVYGASKAAGELAIRAATEEHLIIRTTGLYGSVGIKREKGNFVETMLRRAERGETVSVVDDQVLTPSYTVDVARTMAALIDRDVRGTVHVTNGGQCSWYEFASEIFRLSGTHADLRRTTQQERPMPARRPAYSVLGHDRLQALGVPELREWREALAAYIHARTHIPVESMA